MPSGPVEPGGGRDNIGRRGSYRDNADDFERQRDERPAVVVRSPPFSSIHRADSPKDPGDETGAM
jgi:hypothetical protein